MKRIAYQPWLLAVLVGASLASAARAEMVASPFEAPSGIEAWPVSTVRMADPAMAPADLTLVTHGVETASPGAGDEFYVDWVSPLQAPRGPAAADLTSPGSAFSELDPLEAFAVTADENSPPLSIPEPSTVALLGAAILPLASLLRRR